MKQNVLEDDIFWLESRTLDICLRNYLSAVSLTWIGTIPAMPTKKDFSADAYPYSVREGVRRKNLFNEHFLDPQYLIPGWQMLRERGSNVLRNVRVFYKRKDPQHTLFCPET